MPYDQPAGSPISTGLIYNALMYLRHGEGSLLDVSYELTHALNLLFRELRMAQQSIQDNITAMVADVNALRGFEQQMLERQRRMQDAIDTLEQTRASMQAQLQRLQADNPQVSFINAQNDLTGIREQLDALRAETESALAGMPNSPAVPQPRTTPTAADLGTPPAPVNNPPRFEPTGTTPTVPPTPQPAPEDTTGTQPTPTEPSVPPASDTVALDTNTAPPPPAPAPPPPAPAPPPATPTPNP